MRPDCRGYTNTGFATNYGNVKVGGDLGVSGTVDSAWAHVGGNVVLTVASLWRQQPCAERPAVGRVISRFPWHERAGGDVDHEFTVGRHDLRALQQRDSVASINTNGLISGNGAGITNVTLGHGDEREHDQWDAGGDEWLFLFGPLQQFQQQIVVSAQTFSMRR